MDTMRVWQVAGPGRLERARRPVPQPAPEEILVRVLACGVCRTDLHVRDGDLPPHRPNVVPGHEAVGRVAQTGTAAAAQWSVGQLVGVPWLRHVCGRCRFCLRGDENLCPESTYTGWDADGGYAEYVVVPAAFAYELPPDYDELELAPDPSTLVGQARRLVTRLSGGLATWARRPEFEPFRLRVIGTAGCPGAPASTC